MPRPRTNWITRFEFGTPERSPRRKTSAERRQQYMERGTSSVSSNGTTTFRFHRESRIRGSSALENIDASYKKILASYRGKTVTVESYAGNNLIGSVRLTVPRGTKAKAFNRWWNEARRAFLTGDSPPSSILDEATTTANNFRIVVRPDTPVNPRMIKQAFAEGINHCVLTPILNWATTKWDEAAEKTSTKRTFNTIKNNTSALLKQYQNKGIPQDQLQYLANKCNIEMTISVPFGGLSNATLVNVKSNKSKVKKHFRFQNTKLNHVDVITCTSECTPLSQDEMQDKYRELMHTKTPYTYKTNYLGEPVRINTHEESYTLDTEFNRVCADFEERYGFADIKLCAVKDSELTNFIKDSRHECGTFDLKPRRSWKAEEILQIDMYRAYSSFKCTGTHYKKFCGKITDFRKVDGLSLEQAPLGFYRVVKINDEHVSPNMRRMVSKLKCFIDNNVYCYQELCYYKYLGYDFDLIEGAMGTEFEFEFSEDMIEKRTDPPPFSEAGPKEGMRFYVKWCGLCYSMNDTEEYFMDYQGDDNDAVTYFENLAAVAKETSSRATITYAQNGRGVVSTPRDRIQHLAHISSQICAYQRINMFMQLEKMNHSKIIRLAVDGIYYYDHAYELNPVFRTKTEQRLGNDAVSNSWVSNISGVDFLQDDDEYDECETESYHGCSPVKASPRVFAERELFIGAGGNGKTHYNLNDTGLIRPLYVAPSNKLCAAKEKEGHGIPTENLFQVLGKSSVDNQGNKKFDDKSIAKYRRLYNTLIIDEASQISEEQKEDLFKKYKGLKIIFCGDLGYQLPAVNGTEMTHAGFQKVTELTENYRFRCDTHRNIIRQVRNAIKHKASTKVINNFISEQYQKITKDELCKKYKKEDMILCARHEICNGYTALFDSNEYPKYKGTRCAAFHSILNGEVVHEPGPAREYRHGYTIHSVQGETYDDNIYLDLTMNNDPRQAYTAISRARYANQVYILI